MTDLRFTEDHEWVRRDGDSVVVGITDYAQQQLGDIVFVELPAPGKAVDKGGEVAVIESVKAASEVYAPAAGEIVAVNDALSDDPGLVNSSPHDEGWFVKMKLTDPSALDGLMDEAAYQAHTEGLA